MPLKPIAAGAPGNVKTRPLKRMAPTNTAFGVGSVPFPNSQQGRGNAATA